jgi:hypothetical protein
MEFVRVAILPIPCRRHAAGLRGGHMPTSRTPGRQLLGRGVYLVPCLSPNGHAALYAVDHNHCWIHENLGGVREILPGQTYEEVNAELWALLNRLDPVSDVA